MNVFWWYNADRDLATKIVDVHDRGLATWCAAHADRFVALTSPALQFPDLAAQQLEHAVKDLNMRGAAVGGHVAGEPITMPKYDPFWAKAQELGVIVFMHPWDAANVVTEDSLKVRGDLVNIVGMPLETTVFLYPHDFRRHPGSLPRTKNLRGSWRRLSAFLQWKNGSSLRGAPQRGLRKQEKAQRISQDANPGRFDGFFERGYPPLGRGNGSEPSRLWNGLARVRAGPTVWMRFSARK